MYQGNAHTQHCPEGDDVNSRFRAGLGENRKPKLRPIPDDLSRYCWDRVVSPSEITIEEYNQFLRDHFEEYHSRASRLYLDRWLMKTH